MLSMECRIHARLPVCLVSPACAGADISAHSDFQAAWELSQCLRSDEWSAMPPHKHPIGRLGVCLTIRGAAILGAHRVLCVQVAGASGEDPGARNPLLGDILVVVAQVRLPASWSTSHISCGSWQFCCKVFNDKILFP